MTNPQTRMSTLFAASLNLSPVQMEANWCVITTAWLGSMGLSSLCLALAHCTSAKRPLRSQRRWRASTTYRQQQSGR